MKKIIFLTVLLGIAALLGALFFLTRRAPKIVVVPEQALLDEPLAITVSNLAPHETVALEASCKDKDNNVWKSSATFQADDKGVVDVDKQEPIDGSYKGIEPMGLFWSMVPTSKDPAKNTNDSFYTLNVGEVILAVFSDNKLRAQKTIHRSFHLSDIEIKMIQDQGFVGALISPKNIKKGPGIITVSGSGCGMVEAESLLLASHGYTVLALAHCGLQGLPDKVSQIPLEYFQKAMQWFKKQPQIAGNKIALMGQSSGAELILLLASTFPDEMDAIIVYSPSHLVHGDGSAEEKSNWTYKNKPIPFMPFLSNDDVYEGVKAGDIIQHQGTIEDPFQIVQLYVYGMKKFSAQIEPATIPVEKIRCPVLILCGDDDKMWPSALSGNRIMERLDTYGSTIKKKLVIYPHAGNHIFIHPYAPAIDVPCSIGFAWNLIGGTAEGNAHAREQAWKEALAFLQETLT